MRSRYSAYARGMVDYILATTDPCGPQVTTAESVQRFCDGAVFTGLVIHGSGTDGAGEGWVDFTARLSMGGRDASFRERSRFRRAGKRWFYHSGERLPRLS